MYARIACSSRPTRPPREVSWTRSSRSHRGGIQQKCCLAPLGHEQLPARPPREVSSFNDVDAGSALFPLMYLRRSPSATEYFVQGIDSSHEVNMVDHQVPFGCRRAGDLAATPAAHAWPGNSRAALTPLHQRPSARPAPCRHLRSPEAPGKHRGPARPRTGGTGVNTCSFSMSVSTKPRNRLSPVIVMPSATTIVASANVLPSSTRATTSSPERFPLLEFAEFRRAGLNERAGHRRPRQADRPGNRLGGRRVVAARDPIQHAPQQQVIDGAIAMQRFVRPQWNLALRDMANPGHANRHALAGQPDRPGVAPMTAPAD